VEQLFASGHVVDIILALMLAEYLGLRLYLARTGHAISSLGLATFLLSGAFLVLALRVALTGGGWMGIAVFLIAAFIVHLIDLRARLARVTGSSREMRA
jgi:hypothetical protein